MVLLETKNLSKSFGGLRALWDVNAQIEQGTIHGLIGPNGQEKVCTDPSMRKPLPENTRR